MATGLPAGHPPIASPKVGVLLLNLGTPDGTDYWSVRRYLSEFLSDPRVIESPQWLWQPILQGVVLSTRPQKSGANYARIWDREANESPLRVITRKQATKLQERLGKHIVVDFAMRYGNPSTKAGIEALQAAGCQKTPGAALSAILGNYHGDGQRQGVRCAEDAALAAGGADAPGLFR